MVFWKGSIIKFANKDDHKSCVLSQICIAYNLILTCRWYVKFLTSTSLVTSKRMSTFYITRQILLTHVANNWHVQFYPFIPRHFEVLMKNAKTSVSFSFEFGEDIS